MTSDMGSAVPGWPDDGAIVVLDGGLATELMARGHDLSDRLWSARLLLSDPAAIEDSHLAYLRAGAQVATTASYQASVEGFAAVGLSRAEALDLIRLQRDPGGPCPIDVPCRDGDQTAPVLIAGSVGPYGAYLADGSEYRGDYADRPGRAARLPPAADGGARRGRRGPARHRDHPDHPRRPRSLVGLLDEVGASAWLSYAVPGRGDHRGRRAHRGGRRARRSSADRRRRGQLHRAPLPAGTAVPCQEATSDAADRLSERRRPLGRREPDLGRRRGRTVRSGGRRDLVGPGGDLARGLLRHSPADIRDLSRAVLARGAAA